MVSAEEARAWGPLPQRWGSQIRFTDLAHTVAQQAEQIAALTAGLGWVQGEHSRNPWHPDRTFPTESSRDWHDGYITCAAHQAIEVVKFIDPERYERERDEWRRLMSDTDMEYFQRTGHCGACGLVASSCECDGKCDCAEAHGPALKLHQSPAQQIAAVLALHERWDTFAGDGSCGACLAEPWPCPTARALGVTS